LPSGVLQVSQDFAGGSLAGLDAAVQVSLEVLRRVLAREVAVALPLLLHAGELRELPDLPVRVGALRPGVGRPEVDRRGRAVPVRGYVDARELRSELAEELQRAFLRRSRAEARTDRAAGVVDENPLLPALRAGDLPGVLVAGVCIGVAVVLRLVPEAVVELNVELRVRPHRQLLDRRDLQLLEAGLHVVDRAQHRERDRKHDMVDRRRPRGRSVLERERERAAAVLLDRGEDVILVDLLDEARLELERDLIVSAPDVVLLVRRDKDSELPVTRVTEEIEEVERALLAALGAVLDGVRDVEHAAEVRAGAPWHGLVEPVDDRHVIELPAALGVEVPQRRITRCRDVLVHLLVDRVQVDQELRVRVLGVVYVEEVLRSLGLSLEQVVERKAELLRQLAHGRVSLVDHLAAMLRELAVETRVVGPAAPADASRM